MINDICFVFEQEIVIQVVIQVVIQIVIQVVWLKVFGTIRPYTKTKTR